MPKFTIQRGLKSTTYSAPLFTIATVKGSSKSNSVLATFSNGHDAVSVLLPRIEIAYILKRKFKNHVDRRRERA